MATAIRKQKPVDDQKDRWIPSVRLPRDFKGRVERARKFLGEPDKGEFMRTAIERRLAEVEARMKAP